jgi:hypothetical protein
VTLRTYLVVVTALPALASAQSIRGVVVDSAGRSPVPGVVLLLLDQSGQVDGRALSNERGEYRLSGRSAGDYRVRTLRIGFRPMISDLLTLRVGGEIDHDFVLAGVPLSLDTVRVAARSACAAYPDSTAPLAAAWEQVRTALLAAQLTANTRTINATILRYWRTYDPSRKRILEQNESIGTNFVVKPWRSLSADSLRRFGYVQLESNGIAEYNAPDLDVLLSPQFIGDHCFRLAVARDARLLGIAFEPTRDRSAITDIRGTLWLDRASSELRRMDFRYMNLPREIEHNEAGGEIDFVRMANGAWAIARWDIRMPVFQQRPEENRHVPGMTPGMTRRLYQWRVAGGEMILVRRGADTLWARSTPVFAAAPSTVQRPVPSVAVPPTPAPVAVSVPVATSRPAIPGSDSTHPGSAAPPEFDVRRQLRDGQFFTRADMAKAKGRTLPDILITVPGVRIERVDGRVAVTSGHSSVTSLRQSGRTNRYGADSRDACLADVFLNGIPVYRGSPEETPFDIGGISPSLVDGIEFYALASQTPARYGRMGATCGTLLIWARQK